MKSPHIVTQSELSAVFTLSRKTIRELERDGMPVTGTGRAKRYDLSRVFSFLRDRWEQQATEASDDPEMRRWRKARADLSEHELSVKRREYVRGADVAIWWSEWVSAARSALQGVGQAVAPQAVGQAPEVVRTLIDDRLRRICEDLASHEFTGTTDESEDIGS